MPSELALQIAQRNKETTETFGALGLANDADAELQEVREVLNGLRTWFETDGSYGTIHWCNPDEAHGPDCERAQRLHQRLRVDGSTWPTVKEAREEDEQDKD